MGQPHVYTKSLTAASANSIALSQTLGAAGSVTLNGASAVNGVAVLDQPRRVLITSAGNDSGITFNVTGYRSTTETSSLIVQTVTGAGIGTVATALDFGQILSIASSGATAGAITVGTNTTGSTPWCNFNTDITPHNTQIGVIVTGTVTYGIEYTMDDLNRLPSAFPQPAPSPSIVPNVWPDQNLAPGSTASGTTQISFPFWGVRATITAGTGTVSMTVIQSGIAGP